jgi:hypothetical protein
MQILSSRYQRRLKKRKFKLFSYSFANLAPFGDIQFSLPTVARQHMFDEALKDLGLLSFRIGSVALGT